MNFDEYVALRTAKKKFEEMSGFNNGDPATNGEYSLLKSLSPYFSLFVDVGYNYGDMSTHVGELKKGVKILGFEPHPVLAKQARHKVHATALSDAASADMTFHIHSTETAVSSLAERTEFNPSFREGFTEVKVAVARLDQFANDFECSASEIFLKIDVEGFEAKVIRGGTDIFKRFKPVGYFEYTNGWLEAREKFRDLFYFLDSLGYSCYRITPAGLEHLRFFHFIMENYVYQNIFFCPKNYLDGKLKDVEIPNEFSSTRFFRFG